MILFVKLILIAAFATIAYQDIKDRYVYWFLFPVVGALVTILHYNSVLPEIFKASVFINLACVGLIVSIIYLYAKLKMKMTFERVIGLGDLLLFLALTLAFSTLTFVILFSFSLIFSLAIHLYSKTHYKNNTVPLAGYMSLFFALIYLSSWFGLTSDLYAI